MKLKKFLEEFKEPLIETIKAPFLAVGGLIVIYFFLFAIAVRDSAFFVYKCFDQWFFDGEPQKYKGMLY